MKEKVFSTNEVIFREGDQGTCFYQIVDGTVGVYLSYGEADEQKLTEMKAGQYFGEMAIIEGWPRSTTVVAESELRVLEIDGNQINEYFKEQPDKIIAIMKQLGSRIRTLTEEYDEVTAFLKEKQEAGAEKKEGLLGKIRKYRDISRRNKKNGVRYSVEDIIKMKTFAKEGETSPMVKSFKRGMIVFREGEKGLYMYAVHFGSVGIYTNYGNPLEKKLTTLYANSFFGEMGLVDPDVLHSATAVVEEDGTMLEAISEDNLQNLFRENPLEVDMILCHLSNRLRRLTIDYCDACEKASAES